MKKIICALLALCFLGTSLCFAQAESGAVPPSDEGWEVHGGYGVFTIPSLAVLYVSILGGVVDAIVSDEEQDELDFTDYGVFSFGADYYFNSHVYVGGEFTFQPFHAAGTNLLFVSLMPHAGVQYGWQRFKFYHEIYAGAGILNLSQFYPTGHLTVLGLKFAPADNFWIFADGGFGQRGLFNFGLRYKP